jgi:hypothetical protein
MLLCGAATRTTDCCSTQTQLWVPELPSAPLPRDTMLQSYCWCQLNNIYCCYMSIIAVTTPKVIPIWMSCKHSTVLHYYHNWHNRSMKIYQRLLNWVTPGHCCFTHAMTHSNWLKTRRKSEQKGGSAYSSLDCSFSLGKERSPEPRIPALFCSLQHV